MLVYRGSRGQNTVICMLFVVNPCNNGGEYASDKFFDGFYCNLRMFLNHIKQ